jgi:hypothetical protein
MNIEAATGMKQKPQRTAPKPSRKPIPGNQRPPEAVVGQVPAGKPNVVKRMLSGVPPMTAAQALEGIDVRAIVHDLLKNGSRPVKLQTLTVLWDRVYGKPKQDVSVSGGLVHAHTRDPFLASLPKEALEALARSYDEVLAKHALPAPQSGPLNQIESKPAIEAVAVESKGIGEEKA